MNSDKASANIPKVLVIIPAFNESEAILTTVRKLEKIKEVDYLVVDDGSYDSTMFVLKENHANYISNKTNMGLSKTMREGMKYALAHNYDYCIQFDGDGQHDENTIPEMIKKSQEGYDIILTSRFLGKENEEQKKDALKSLAWKFFKFSFKVKGKIKITDPTCGLRMYDKRFMETYVGFEKFEVEPSTILYCCKKLNFKIVEIPTTVFERKSGKSLFKKPWNVAKYMSRQVRRMWITSHFWKVNKNQ